MKKLIFLFALIITCGLISCVNSSNNQSSNEAPATDNAIQDTTGNYRSSALDSTNNDSANHNELPSSLSINGKGVNTSTTSVPTASGNQATSQTTTKKKALIIGLGKQKDKSWAKINGDKDIPYVQQMLKGFGYGDILTLVNEQATKSAIVSAFKALAAKCNKGDIVYIHFSGHGQQVTDVNGDEVEKDGWDEAWIPYDAYLMYGNNDKGEKHLIDDEINVLLNSIANKIGNDGKLLVVVDACHSGGSTRGSSTSVDNNAAVRGSGANDTFNIPCNKKGKSTKSPVRWLTLSACDYYQVNQEIAKPQVGKLTYALYMTSQEGKANLNDITVFMDKYKSRLPQTPILAGKEFVKYDISDFFKK